MRLLSREAVLWSEMEKPGAILKAADASSLRKLDRLLQRGSDEGYEVFQIGGSDPVTVAAATRLVLPYGYDEPTLNCGCPAITSGGGDYGASLMRRGGDDAARVIEAMVHEAQKRDPKNTPKISVKAQVSSASGRRRAPETRVERGGSRRDQGNRSTRSSRSADVLRCRRALLPGGHDRPVALEESRRGQPRPELVFELCSTRSTSQNELEFVLNGGVSSFADAANVFSACPTLKGAQAGRWPLLRPFDVLHVDAFLMRVLTQDASLREENLPTGRSGRGDDRERALSLRLRPASRGARGGGSGDVRVSGPVVYGGGVAKKETGAGAAGAAARRRARGPRRPTRGGR